MTASDANRPDAVVTPLHLASDPPAQPVVAAPRPLPRLGRGLVWSAIVAEMERDHRARLELRDAA